jgi:hypothetical protein
MKSPHDELIAQAAKTALGPLGCKRKGRSRIWLDDRGWWLGVIEFQPSSWTKGSYLNVGACWLWNEKDYLSFDNGPDDQGSRIEAFHEYKEGEDFSGHAKVLAGKAANAIISLRTRFTNVHSVAEQLDDNKAKDMWGHYSAGISLGLVGATRRAETHFDAVRTANMHAPWVEALQKEAGNLSQILDDKAVFRSKVVASVKKTRGLLKLPAIASEIAIEP